MNFPKPSASATAPTFEQLRAACLAGSAEKSAVDEFFEIFQQLTPPFQNLLGQIFAQPGIWEAFVQGPSSRKGHHCGRGGNLRHSVEVTRLSLCIAAADFENLVDRDVLIVAALMHDLGKAQEYEAGWYGTKMSPLGRLVGHKSSGFGMVWGPLHSTPGIGECQRLAILNSLSSSENAAAKEVRGPASFEALIVNRSDQLSAAGDLFRASHAASGAEAGFGRRHDHQRETPYHVKPRLPVLAQATLAAQTTQRPSLKQRLDAALKASSSH
ncbi:MAG: HD domain-containing protein [Polaromonas sp.]|nr:HD domain-containing protein [Polaromonas sp.]